MFYSRQIDIGVVTETWWRNKPKYSKDYMIVVSPACTSQGVAIYIKRDSFENVQEIQPTFWTEF
jgi:hypothetical protein